MADDQTTDEQIAVTPANPAVTPVVAPAITAKPVVFPLSDTEKTRRAALIAMPTKTPAETAELAALEARVSKDPVDVMKLWMRDELDHLQAGFSRHMRERLNP